MSGHSKWANIKRKKEVNDKAKANVFAKLARVITMAVIEGGGITDPATNVRLRLAIEKAKESNVPKDNIARAIEKGSGPNSSQLKETRYEGFGPGGVSLYIIASTDNQNRTISEVRNVMDRNGGKLGNQGSVAYQFQHCGVLSFELAKNSEEEIMEFAERVDALDIDETDSILTIFIPFEKLGTVHEQLGSLVPMGTAEVIFRPLTPVSITPDHEEKLIHLIEALEELDDVHEVFTNAQ